MPKKQREGKFKLGQFHGKFLPVNNTSEAHIRQTVFLSQRLQLWLAKGKSIAIRIFGYEIPLKTGCKRGECLDIMGYDNKYNLYLIELKKGDSHEPIAKIVEQINGYGNEVWENLRDKIEDDFKNEFFFPISFNEIKKIVLAPREFYEKKKIKGEVLIDKGNIIYTYFRNKEIHAHDIKNTIKISVKK